MNRIAFGCVLELLHHGLQPLLEVAAIAGAGEQRAHVEREDRGVGQHARRLAVDDLAREALGDRGLADAGVADEQRVVLAPAAQHLDAALDLEVAADQRIDVAAARLLVEIDAVFLQRRLLGVLGVGGLLLRFRRALCSLHRACLSIGRVLRDAVADVVHRVVAGHVLLLQEIGGVALALGEDRDEHVGAGHLGAARALDVDRGALDHPLEAGGRRGLGAVDVGDQRVELLVEEGDDVLAQLVDLDPAGLHHPRGVRFVEQREQQMLERREFVLALVGMPERVVDRGFKSTRERGHNPRPSGLIPPASPPAQARTSMLTRHPLNFGVLRHPSRVIMPPAWPKGKNISARSRRCAVVAGHALLIDVANSRRAPGAASGPQITIRKRPCAAGSRRRPRRRRPAPARAAPASPGRPARRNGLVARSRSSRAGTVGRSAARSAAISAARARSAGLSGSRLSAKRMFEAVYSWPE